MFAAGNTRLYSGSREEKQRKSSQNAPMDYAEWRLKNWEHAWLKRRIEGNIWHGLTVCSKENNEPIGHVVIGGGELAYFFIKNCWNQGYGSEAVMALLSIAVPYIYKNHPELSCPDVINATVRIDHDFSQRILKKAGFTIDETTEISEKYGHTRYELKVPVENLLYRYELALDDYKASSQVDSEEEKHVPSQKNAKQAEDTQEDVLELGMKNTGS